MTDQKNRHWAVIVYPDSAPENWLQILDEMHCKAMVSPLHDKDLNEDGTQKKPHYHVIVSYDGPITKKLASERLSVLNGPAVQAVVSLTGSARYLCHLDSPDKAAYEVGEVQTFGGIDYFEVISTNSDRLQAIAEMQEFCDENNIVSYAELSRYARNNRRDWFRYLANSATVVMTQYLKSRVWESTRNAGVGDSEPI